MAQARGPLAHHLHDVRSGTRRVSRTHVDISLGRSLQVSHGLGRDRSDGAPNKARHRIPDPPASTRGDSRIEAGIQLTLADSRNLRFSGHLQAVGALENLVDIPREFLIHQIVDHGTCIVRLRREQLENPTSFGCSRVPLVHRLTAAARPFANDFTFLFFLFLYLLVFLLVFNDVHGGFDFDGLRFLEDDVFNEPFIRSRPKAQGNRDKERDASNAPHPPVGIRHQGRDERFRGLCCLFHDVILLFIGLFLYGNKEIHYPEGGALS